MQRTLDPQLQYCPKCGDEYRSEIVVCAACTVPLISGKAIMEQQQQKDQKQVERRRPISPDDELISIQKGSMLQMQMVQSVLKQAGIPSLMVNESGSCSQGCCGPSLLLQIRMTDLEDAQAILAEDYIRSTGLDTHDLSTVTAVFDTEADSAVCPACGCSFSTTSNTCPDCGLCFA